MDLILWSFALQLWVLFWVDFIKTYSFGKPKLPQEAAGASTGISKTISSKQSTVKACFNSLCFPPDPMQGPSTRTQDTTIRTRLRLDSQNSVSVCSSDIPPCPCYPVVSDKEDGGVPRHPHPENNQNASVAANEVCLSPDPTRQRPGQPFILCFYLLCCFAVSLGCEKPIALSCQIGPAAYCSLTVIHRDKPLTGHTFLATLKLHMHPAYGRL